VGAVAICRADQRDGAKANRANSQIRLHYKPLYTQRTLSVPLASPKKVERLWLDGERDFSFKENSMKIRHLILAFVAIIVPPSCGCHADDVDRDAVWDAICQVESGGDAGAYNPVEDARGIAQIRAIMVEDINRIVGDKRYSHDDAYDPVKAREMFDIYNRHYHPKGDYERIARCWNGGPRGHKKQATLAYWRKVERVMKDD